MKNLARIAFFVLALLNILGTATLNQSLIYFTKPLLIPALAVWLTIASNHHKGEYSFFRRSVLGALVFSTLGDVLLMFSGEIFFLLGLFFFLLAHLFYIGAFTSVSSFKTGFLSQNSWWALPFLAFPIVLLLLLWDGIGAGMRLPVAAYACVITLMALSVLNLKGTLTDSIFKSMLLGAGLFVVSDSLIAVSKFGAPFIGSSVVIIFTYILGQYLLVNGVVRELKTAAVE